MNFKSFKLLFKKFWNFVWHDDSILSWIVNIVLAFVIVKFLLYPGLGLLLGTNYPVVAVVSGSMEHNGFNFDEWWQLNEKYYENFNITKEEFSNYIFKNGFNKGDLVVLRGAKEVNPGDVIVFMYPRSEPIIHRAVIAEERNGKIFIQTKGDNNPYSIPGETEIPPYALVGKAWFKLPYLGWFKLGFLKLFGLA
jgi:signal peptidase I